MTAVAQEAESRQLLAWACEARLLAAVANRSVDGVRDAAARARALGELGTVHRAEVALERVSR
jgi:hypothetical protein